MYWPPARSSRPMARQSRIEHIGPRAEVRDATAHRRLRRARRGHEESGPRDRAARGRRVPATGNAPRVPRRGANRMSAAVVRRMPGRLPKEIHDAVDHEERTEHRRGIEGERLLVFCDPALSACEELRSSWTEQDVKHDRNPHEHGGNYDIEHGKSNGVRAVQAGCSDCCAHNERDTDALRTGDPQHHACPQRSQGSEVREAGTDRQGPGTRTASRVASVSTYMHRGQEQRTTECDHQGGDDVRMVLAVG